MRLRMGDRPDYLDRNPIPSPAEQLARVTRRIEAEQAPAAESIERVAA
ncbi:hypothetical protein [Rhodococcoides fascians]|nr:hypothetical protein [Rhodococcus fascians]